VGELERVVEEFRRWAANQDIRPPLSDVQVTSLGAPHRPVPLAPGSQGVYCFQLGLAWLKVAKVGPKSGARWVSQHYKATRSLSNLSWSLFQYAYHSSLEHPNLPATLKEQIRSVDPYEIGSWIKQQTARVNLTINAKLGPVALDRLEKVAQAVLNPVFEGRWDPTLQNGVRGGTHV
jgi:hypothetical protein